MTDRSNRDQPDLRSAQQEAIRHLEGVITAFTTGGQDLASSLRACQHACELMGWTDSKMWFDRQLTGYSHDQEVEAFRIVQGTTRWDPKGFSFGTTPTLAYLRSQMPGATEADELQGQPCLLPVRSSLAGIQSLARTGWVEKLGKTFDHQRGVGIPQTWEESCVHQPHTFQHVLSLMEQFTFEFASHAISALKYGQIVTSIWAQYLQSVEQFLTRASMRESVDAITLNFQAGSPQALRAAAFACRNLIQDLANYLWQDPRESYSPLNGDAKDGKLKVTKDRYANRLRAYIHQKSLGKNARKFLEDEVDRIATSFRSLSNLQSTAHEAVSEEDASMIILATLFLIGVLIQKTDMQPVTAYSESSA